MAFKEGRSNQRPYIFKDQEMDFQWMRVLSTAGEGGADIGECLAVASHTKDKDVESYARAWSDMAEQLKKRAEQAQKKGHRETARQCYIRASNYLRAAMGTLSPKHPNHQKYWKASRDCFDTAGQLFETPFAGFTVPFGGGLLPCYFLRPLSDEILRPTLIVATGGEGTNMEMYFWAAATGIKRGYNVLLFEGPHNPGGNYLGAQPLIQPENCEQSVSAVIDELLKQKGVDPERIAIIGYSFGGYVSIRAAAHDKRIKALIPDSPLRSLLRVILSSYPKSLFAKIPEKLLAYAFNKLTSPSQKPIIDVAMTAFGADSIKGMIGRLENFGVEGLEEKITCPTLALAGEDEGGEFLAQADTFFKAISAKNKNKRIFTINEGAGGHCQVGNLTIMQQVVFDWLDELWPIQHCQ